MAYQFESRVRYSEVDMQMKLTLNGMINYFQDCSTFHSEAIGLGIDYLSRRKRGWILSAWQIDIERFPEFGERISVQTWPYGFKAFYGDRNFAMLDQSGRQIVKANSLWIYMDTESGRPIKVEKDQMEGYVPEEKLEMEYMSRKIPFPEGAVEQEPLLVQKHHLDTNYHVNNGQYVQMAHEFLPDGFRLRQMRAEYKKSAVLHDTIVPWVLQEERKCTAALCDGEKNPYAIVSFQK